MRLEAGVQNVGSRLQHIQRVGREAVGLRARQDPNGRPPVRQKGDGSLFGAESRALC